MTPVTLLLRQVNPSFVQEGKITPQVFRPTDKDNYELSTYNGDMITPSDAWERFVAQPSCRSVGVLAVCAQECTDQDLKVHEDGVPFPEHCSIDFSGYSKSEVEKKAKLLKIFAERRGWLYQA